MEKQIPTGSCVGSFLDRPLTQISSHHAPTPTPQTSQSKVRPRPLSRHQDLGRPRARCLPPSTHAHFHILILLVLTCVVSLSSASTIYIPEQMVEAPKNIPAAVVPEHEDLASALSRLAQTGPILVDHSPPPPKAALAGAAHDWQLATLAEDLRRRKRQVGGDEQDDKSSSTTAPASKTKTTSTSTSADAGNKATTATTPSPSTTAPTKSSSSSGIAAATEAANSPLPQIFDNGFSGNITNNCASFMSSMLSNASFLNCLPFSLFLQNSNSFFQAQKSVTRITQVLDATCAANVTSCTTLLTSFANNITSTSACAADLSTANPLIQQAQVGLQTYAPLYAASCLRNANTSSYCYADAITKKNRPDDSYVYFLPLGKPYPGGSQPTCSQCLKDTMAVFGATTGKAASYLKTTYSPAAMQVNLQCGPGFVNGSLTTTPTAAAGLSLLRPVGLGSSGAGMFALAVLVGSWLF